MKRYAKLATSALNWWLDEASNKDSNVVFAETSTLFLKAFDFLVSRDTGGHEIKSSLQEKPHRDGVYANKVIKARIQRMEVGL